MKLATFEQGGRSGWGVVEGDQIRDMRGLLPQFPTLKALIAGDGMAAAREAAKTAPLLPLSEIAWLPVIQDPAKILCCGLNYVEHREETNNPVLGHPTIFVRFAEAQNGHERDVLHPPETAHMDYEAELAVIIGKGGRRIPRDKAYEAVAGYACYNDISIRNWQRHTTQMTPGKNFPTCGPFGPWMVTPDEVGELAPLSIQLRLNGQLMQDAHLGDMIFDVPALIEYCSTFTALAPGDVIITGTPGGVGQRRDPQVFMKPGDTVEVEIEKVGLLRNRIVTE